MFRVLASLLRRSEEPKEPFTDPALGKFEFSRGLGWKGHIVLGGKKAELVFGSDGEPPSDEMIKTAKAWIDAWPVQFPKIIEYVRNELLTWSDEPNLPVPDKFEVESINILWKEEPATAMIYFHYPGDDIRSWHVTFRALEPQSFAYDD